MCLDSRISNKGKYQERERERANPRGGRSVESNLRAEGGEVYTAMAIGNLASCSSWLKCCSRRIDGLTCELTK